MNTKYNRSSSARFAVVFTALLTTIFMGRPAAADTLNLAWDPNAEPEVVGYIVHVGTQPGTYTQHIDVGPATTWAFTSAVAGQQYCFAVSAYFAGPTEGPQSTEVCGFSNAPPVLVNPGAQSSTVGQADTLQLAGSDPKGDPVTYIATGLPPGLTLMASTGFISGTPTTAGTYSVTGRVSDGVLTASQIFTWTVTTADTTAPVVAITGPTSAAAYTTTGLTLTLSGSASDAVGVTQVSWVNSRGGSGTASGTTSWTASVTLQAGSNVVTVAARDAAGNTSSDVLTVTVNGPPTIGSVANQSSVVGLSTTLQLVGGDPNGDALTYAATGLPSGLTLGISTGLVSGFPTVVGTYNVTVSVSDGFLTASRTFTWTVTASTSVPGTLQLAWDASSDLRVIGYKVYVGTQPGVYGQSFDVGLTTTWTFTNPVAGQQYCFAVSAYIAGGIEGAKSSEVCGYSNQPPTADTTAPVVIITGPTSSATIVVSTSAMTLSGTAFDSVGVTQVSWANNRGGSGTATGTTSWSAAGVVLQSGANLLTVTARDAAGNVSTDALTVTLNTAPTLAAVPNQSTAQATAASLQLAGADADGGTLSYGANGLPPGLAIAVSTGLIAGTPTIPGSYPITVTVSDGALTATRTFTWTVTYSTGDTTAPAVTITSPTTAATFASTKSTVTLRGSASDNIGVTQVTWRNDRGGSGTATGTKSWSVTKVTLQAGVNVLTVTARDAAGNTSSDVLTVTYTPPLHIASLTADRVAPQPLGTTVTFTAVAAGGTAPYAYQWRVYNGTKWVTASGWSSNNRFVWTPTTATSLYQVRAVVRSATMTTAMKTMSFPIVP